MYNFVEVSLHSLDLELSSLLLSQMILYPAPAFCLSNFHVHMAAIIHFWIFLWLLEIRHFRFSCICP